VQNETIQLDRLPGGAAVLRVSVPGKVNLLTTALLAEAEAVLESIESDPSIDVCAIVSAKDENFIAGADVRELLAAASAEDIRSAAARAQALFNRIATSGKTYVAAIHGAAMGGGLELALACRVRVATNDPRTVFALPEVNLGLIPAAGGTQRLPRLVGLRSAVPMIVGAQRIRSQRAMSIGLVDAIAPRDLLLHTAIDLGRRPPEAARRGLFDRLIAKGPLRRAFLDRVRRGVLIRTGGNYPAPLAALDCIEAGYSRGIDAGLDEELRHFPLLATSKGTRNLVRIFLSSNETKRPTAGAEPRPLGEIGVLGAGLMGEGIASVSLPLVKVTLKDVSPEALARADASIRKSIARRVSSGALAPAAAEKQQSRLFTATSYRELRSCDLVIEAVYEELELKRKVLAEIEEVVPPSCVYASNTSAIAISAIAEGSRHPERVVGMHYFSPVPRMAIVELVATPATAEWALRTAQSFALAQGKSVVVVRDSPGFFTTRILAPYLNEAIHLLGEGAGMQEIDRALEAFGFPVGPLTLLNKVGISVAAHVARDLSSAFAGVGHEPPPILERLAAERREFEPREFPSRSRIDPHQIVQRTVLAMVNEAARAVDDGVVGSESDADLAAVLGLGFPPFRGGPLRYVSERGGREVAERLKELESSYGRRFAPARWINNAAAAS
jgi:3-hydroxyacyl-CoA dehydrogenase / enoyl-CoA hydratase / 3-hydroxybutyryl-CoA epimerase